MDVFARFATDEDVPVLVDLYDRLQDEMDALSDLWSIADGLPEPLDAAFAELLSEPSTRVVVGGIDGHPFGFLVARLVETHPQGDGLVIGSIILVFVDHPAREVGIGEAMRTFVLEDLARDGITRVDAHVLPGHRLVKNFFEAGGFKARSIVMHNRDIR